MKCNADVDSENETNDPEIVTEFSHLNFGHRPSSLELMIKGTNLNDYNISEQELGFIFNWYRPFCCSLKYFYLTGFAFHRMAKSIHIFHELKVIEIEDSEISSLPEEFSFLTNLKSLKINDCKFIEIPNQICEIIGLKRLEMTYNDILYINPNIEKLQNLNSLLLSGNNISHLPDFMSTMTRITLLQLDDNPMHNDF
jgi:Leucine-rich repeat (LRR) protein